MKKKLWGPFSITRVLNPGTRRIQNRLRRSHHLSFRYFPSLFPSNDSDGESWWAQLFTCSRLKSAPAVFFKARCFLAPFNWLPPFMKYNFVFPLHYRQACSNNARLGESAPLTWFDRLGVKNCRRSQHGADTERYRSFKMFCPNPDNLSNVTAALTASLCSTCDWQIYFWSFFFYHFSSLD